MDLVGRTVRCACRRADFLPVEFRLLEYLMRRPGQALSRAKLLEKVWNSTKDVRSSMVNMQMGNVHRKLDPTREHRYTVNVRGSVSG